MSTKAIKAPSETSPGLPEDPVLQMIGIGKQLWESEFSDQFVERLRAELDESASPPSPAVQEPFPTDEIWQRVVAQAGARFHTARGLPFEYEMEGNGIWFFRNGKRINRKLTRKQFDIGVSRCPLKTTTEIADLMDYAYLFALLMDRRIRGTDW